MLQNATPLRKSAPRPPNISDEHVSCIAPATENASLQILFKCPMPAIVFRNATKHYKTLTFCTFLLTFDKVHNPLRLPRETTSERPIVVRTPGVFHILPSKCASRRNGVHFFDISTSKNYPNPWCLTCWLRNVLRATTACTFSTSQFPKVVREWGVLYIGLRNVLRAITACAFRRLNFQKWSEPGVFCTFWLRNVLRATTACNFSHLASWLRTCRFSEPIFRPPGDTNRTFLPFRAPASSFFWFFLFSDLLSSALLFSILLLHLCFSYVHIVGSLTSKLPSMMHGTKSNAHTKASRKSIEKPSLLTTRIHGKPAATSLSSELEQIGTGFRWDTSWDTSIGL